ncbi:MAG: DUF5329 domain-containing protein [Massilia sp.]
MKIWKIRALALLVLAASQPAVHAQAPDRTAQEITFMLDAVANSPCQFNRNGSWYAGPAARAHLQDKYDYLRKRNLAPTAELFIERGASVSSMSGKPYQIRCPGLAPVDSATWLRQQLARFRKEAS